MPTDNLKIGAAIFSSFLLFAALSCSTDENIETEIVIFSAASLTNAVPEIIDTFQDSLQGARVVYNFAGSSVLARQIMNGGPAGVFLSADTFWVNELVRRNIVKARDTFALLRNRLVVITPKQDKPEIPNSKSEIPKSLPKAQGIESLGTNNTSIKINSLNDLLDESVSYIAIADPAHVPAGKYAKAGLQKAGIWQQVEDKIVTAQDVRAAMAFVEAGEAEVGVVYQTDARMSTSVRVAAHIPEAFQPDIRYVLAAIAPQSDPAKKIMRLLRSGKAAEIFQKHGFVFIAKEH